MGWNLSDRNDGNMIHKVQPVIGKGGCGRLDVQYFSVNVPVVMGQLKGLRWKMLLEIVVGCRFSFWFWGGVCRNGFVASAVVCAGLSVVGFLFMGLT